MESVERKLDMEIFRLKNRIGVLESKVREQKERNETLSQTGFLQSKSTDFIEKVVSILDHQKTNEKIF